MSHPGTIRSRHKTTTQSLCTTHPVHRRGVKERLLDLQLRTLVCEKEPLRPFRTLLVVHAKIRLQLGRDNLLHVWTYGEVYSQRMMITTF